MADRQTSARDVLQTIKDEEIRFLDLKFVDLFGTLRTDFDLDYNTNVLDFNIWALNALTPPAVPTMLTGDANGDGEVNVGDAVSIINYVFKGGAAPDPLCSGDANGDGDVNVADAVYLISYIFKGGPPPAEGCCS